MNKIIAEKKLFRILISPPVGLATICPPATAGTPVAREFFRKSEFPGVVVLTPKHSYKETHGSHVRIKGKGIPPSPLVGTFTLVGPLKQRMAGLGKKKSLFIGWIDHNLFSITAGSWEEGS